jgi:four helix bundle protein
MRHFKQIAVWEKAHQLTLAIYRAVGSFPIDERVRIRQQITRAASSIGANIAEGCGRGGDAELCSADAVGSAFEVDNHPLLARDSGFLTTADHEQLEKQVEEVQQMLSPFIRKLELDLGRSD